jgi:oligo-1,6-glucosidase
VDIELKGNYQHFVVEQQTMTQADFLAAVHKISRDNARTPMQWDDSENAGFTNGTPWFKVNPNYPDINVAKDLKAEKSVFKYYQELIRLRKTEDILKTGTYKLFYQKMRRFSLIYDKMAVKHGLYSQIYQKT